MRTILCIDLEATCWTGGAPPAGQRMEVIEIGYSFLDLSSGMTRSGSILVRPTESQVSRYCTELTGHTAEALEKDGRSFEACCLDLRNLGSQSVPWVSYGEWDEGFFQQQCLRRGVVYPFSFEHYNAKELVNGGFKELIRMGLGYTKGFGLKDACHLFGLGFQGRHHSGKADAENLARLVWKMYKMMDEQIVSKISSDGSRLPRRHR